MDRAKQDWVVLLEAANGEAAATIDRTSFGRLVSSWPTPRPASLYSSSRYALQIPVKAANAPLALSCAISKWRDTLRRTGLPEGELVRAEIFTSEDFELELARAYDGDGNGSAAGRDPVAEELLCRALHDGVTGLAGREMFLHDVRARLATPAVPVTTAVAPATCGIIVVQLTGKDPSGSAEAYSATDQVLLAAAGRLAGTLRCGDTLALVGPAQFALLVEVPSCDHAERLARRILDSLCGFPSGESEPATVKVSIGVAMGAPGDDADHVIDMAEAAMVAARRAGGDCHHLFATSRGTG